MSYERKTWALCMKDGTLAFDDEGRGYVFFSRREALNAIEKAIEHFGETLHVEKVEVY